MGTVKSADEAASFISERLHELYPVKEHTGLILTSWDFSDSDAEKLRTGNAKIAKDVVVLKEGEEPSFVSSVCWVVGGFVLLGLSAASSSTPPKTRSGPPPIPPEAFGRSVPPPIPKIR
jgi:hypothetical protein